MNINMCIEKRKHQEKVNPGNKNKKYVQPTRNRSVVFNSKVAYKRSNNKKYTLEAMHDY